jgi:hypothetical protein
MADSYTSNIEETVVDNALFTEAQVPSEGQPTAGGLPLDPRKTPYMIDIDRLPEYFVSAFVPMWKVIQDAEMQSVRANLEGAAASNKQKILVNYLKQKNTVINKWNTNKEKDATHVAMNSGSFVISHGDERDFLQYYAVAVTAGYKLWFVEQLTPVFRFFCDLDFAQREGVPERGIEAAAFVVQRTVRKFYTRQHASDAPPPESAFRVVACATNRKFKTDEHGKVQSVKTGVHLHWPELYVDRASSLHMRESIMAELQETFGKRVEPQNSWNDVVDQSVYGKAGLTKGKGSGLRMVGSRKTDVCTACKMKKKAPDGGTCMKCLGNGRLDTGRPYFPLLVLSGAGRRDLAEEERYRCSFLQLVLDTKLRTPYETLDALYADDGFKGLKLVWALPAGAPAYIHAGKARRAPKGATALTEAQLAKPAAGPRSGGAREIIVNSSPEWDAIQGFVRSFPGGRFARVLVSSITTNEKRTWYSVHVTGENSRFCHNIDREHSSNRIHFYVTDEGVVQRCHDAGERSAEMRFARCAEYSSNVHKVPDALVAVLFPHSPAARMQQMLQASVLDDGGSVDLDIRPERSARLKRLLQIGDHLSKDLYGRMWSDTLVTADGKHVFATQTTVRGGKGARVSYDTADAKALGSHYTRALRQLGLYDEPDESREDVGRSPEAKRTRGPAPPRGAVYALSQLERLLYRNLARAVEIAAQMDPADAVAGLEHGGFDGLVSASLKVGSTLKNSAAPSSARSAIGKLRDLTHEFA